MEPFVPNPWTYLFKVYFHHTGCPKNGKCHASPVQTASLPKIIGHFFFFHLANFTVKKQYLTRASPWPTTTQPKLIFLLEDYWDGGCVKDSRPRLLPYLKNVGSTNSLTKCRQLCSSMGWSYMGVHAATWCSCGENPPPQSRRVSQGECNQKCPGNSEEMCGALGRLNVYSIKTEGCV